MEARDLLRERPRRFELALRIRHPSIDPREISRQLRLEPEHSFRAGEPRESSSGIAAAAVHGESYWLGSLDPDAWTIGSLAGFEFPGVPRGAPSKERVRTMMSSSLGLVLTLGSTHFLRAHSEFIRRVQSEGGDVALIIEMPAADAQSFTLTPQVAKVLAEVGVSIDFEFTTD